MMRPIGPNGNLYRCRGCGKLSLRLTSEKIIEGCPCSGAMMEFFGSPPDGVIPVIDEKVVDDSVGQSQPV